MAINDRYQLNQYGTEVQKAIDDALVHLPADIALKAYRDEVLTKTQIIPYNPTGSYHPTTKLYVDSLHNNISSRLDDEIVRAKDAEGVLNRKQVLLYDTEASLYKYVNLVNLSETLHALVDENALDRKIAEINTGFFIFQQINLSNGIIEEGRFNIGVNPYAIKNTLLELPTYNVPINSIGLTLGDDSSINVYKYSASKWNLLGSPSIAPGWIFASTSDGHGYYWFSNTWNKVDMDVDMSNYYSKVEMDDYLLQYVRADSLRAVSEITSSGGTIKVTGGYQHAPRNIEVASGVFQPLIPAGNADYILTESNIDGVFGRLTKTTQITNLSSNWSDSRIPTEKAIGNYVTDTINNMDLSDYQLKIPAGIADDILSYSGVDGDFNTLKRSTVINMISNNRSDYNIPTEKAVGDYMDSYKPTVIMQGNKDSEISTSQMVFWIEQ